MVDSSEALIYNSNIMEVFCLTGKNTVIKVIFDLLQRMVSTVIFSIWMEPSLVNLKKTVFQFCLLGCKDKERPEKVNNRYPPTPLPHTVPVEELG
jgi:hypothetical protein